MEEAKILVVEDEGIIAQDIERTLKGLGYSVPAIAASGEEAIQKALETEPDLLLMDIVLRGKMDGVEAAERIRAHQKIPVIYLTAYSDEETFQRAKITEPFGYLLKPFQEKELQSAIEVALYKYRMEKKLKENEQRLSITLRSIHDGVITTKNDGLITFMNPLAEGLTGWKEAETVGRPLEEVFRLIHEGNGKKYEISVKKEAREGVIVGRGDSVLLVAKNGRKRPIDYSLAPLGDGHGNISGTVLAFRDITERKKAEEALQRERDRFEAITQNIGAGVVIISGDYQIISANRVSKGEWGENIEGNPCHLFFHQRAEPCPDCRLREIFEKNLDKVIREEATKDKNGEQSWVQIIVTPIKDTKGNITAALELAVPITERKRTEEALRQSEEAAKQLARENTTLAKIGQIISSTLNIEEIYSRFAEETQKLIPFDRISINTLNDNKTAFSIQYVWGIPIPNRQPGSTFPAAGSLSGEVIKNRYGSLVHIEEEKEIASRLPGFTPVGKTDLQSTLIVPLVSKDEAIGVLFFFSKKPKAYTKDDLKLAESIAAQISGAVANAQLFTQLKQAQETQLRLLQEETILLRIGRIAGSTLNIEEVYERFAEEAKKLIPFERIAVNTLNEGKTTFSIPYVSGIPIPGRQPGDVLSAHGSLSQGLLKNPQPSIMHFAEANPEVLSQFPGLAPVIQAGFRSTLRVPLISKDQIIGILILLSQKPKAYTDHHMQLAESIGAQIAGAIANAQHFAERQRAEKALRKSKEFSENILNSMNEALAIIDVQDFRIVQANKAFFDLVGMEEEKAIGKRCYEITRDRTTPCLSYDHICPISETLKTGNPSTAEHVHYTKDGAKKNVEVSSSPIRNEKGEIVQVVHLERDITEKRNLESQLSQAQKLEAIGQLAAGIAHEINTPTQYVGDNTRFFRDAFKELQLLLDQYSSLLAALKEGQPPNSLIREVEAAAAKIDLPYLSREIPRAIAQTLEGVNRVANIVRAMKEFSHPGTKEKSPLHINHALENAITVSRNEWKYVAEVATDLDPSLPPVPCLPQEFNQAILNIIINAAHAIADALGQPPAGKGTITISTRLAGDWAEIRIRDTGTGIPAEIQSKVFEPFFTTKKVGKGTGQGLTIAHAVVVKKHGGTIHFETEAGKGTTFIIRLPLGDGIGGHSASANSAGKAA